MAAAGVAAVASGASTAAVARPRAGSSGAARSPARAVSASGGKPPSAAWRDAAFREQHARSAAPILHTGGVKCIKTPLAASLGAHADGADGKVREKGDTRRQQPH